MSSPIFDTKAWTSVSRPGDSLNIRPSSGARGEEILDSLPFSLPSFPFSPETPDTQAIPYPASFIIASSGPALCVAHEQYFVQQVEGSGSYWAGGL